LSTAVVRPQKDKGRNGKHSDYVHDPIFHPVPKCRVKKDFAQCSGAAQFGIRRRAAECQ